MRWTETLRLESLEPIYSDGITIVGRNTTYVARTIGHRVTRIDVAWKGSEIPLDTISVTCDDSAELLESGRYDNNEETS